MPSLVFAHICRARGGAFNLMLLAIETSCDETGVALFTRDGKLVKHLVYSQVALHSPFGGIVPEIASRKQLEVLPPLTEKLLKDCGINLKSIKAIAVTFGPGLIGSLLVGVSFAKALCFRLSIPLIKVDHLQAHISAIFLEKHIEFPFVALLVSGGHTAIFLVRDWEEFYLLGHTRDDAAGEAFDKIAKLLGLGYPGGPIISKLAEKGKPGAVKLPRPLIEDPSFDFSFSGLKTAVINLLKKNPNVRPEDLCLEFEKAVAEVLVKKTLSAAEELKIKRIVVAGGVASNRKLRALFKSSAEKKGIECFFPSPEFCTDNAGMVGMLGVKLWERQRFVSLIEEPYARGNYTFLS